MILRSALLAAHGFRHGFSQRVGGVSRGPYASLNLGRTVGDEPAHVAQNTRRFAAAVEVDAARIYESTQVHGARVVVADGREVSDVRREEADALVARGSAVAVRTADCVPILLADPRTGAVAAVHAGWRGVVARVLDAALDALGTTDVLAAIGPHIRAESFEVGEDVAERIAGAAHGEPVVLRTGARQRVDLALAVRAQLAARGVTRIDDVGGCTLREAERFFSHRRDAGVTGRHLSVIDARS